MYCTRGMINKSIMIVAVSSRPLLKFTVKQLNFIKIAPNLFNVSILTLASDKHSCEISQIYLQLIF